MQAQDAVKAKTENHAASILVWLVINTPLPWKLSVAFAVLCWPSDKNLAVALKNVHLLRRNVALRGPFTLHRALLSTPAVLQEHIRVPAPGGCDLGRRRAVTTPVREPRAMFA